MLNKDLANLALQTWSKDNKLITNNLILLSLSVKELYKSLRTFTQIQNLIQSKNEESELWNEDESQPFLDYFLSSHTKKKQKFLPSEN